MALFWLFIFYVETDSEDVIATIKGLKKRALADPAKPPIYIHTSGMGITSDNSRGELVAPETMHKDINFKLSDVKDVTHALSDEAVVAAGTDKDVPIRTMIVFPAWVYGACPSLPFDLHCEIKFA